MSENATNDEHAMIEQLYTDAKKGRWGGVMLVTWEQWRVIRDHEEFTPSNTVSLIIRGKFRDIEVMTA